jgi:hypothetical protein
MASEHEEAVMSKGLIASLNSEIIAGLGKSNGD